MKWFVFIILSLCCFNLLAQDKVVIENNWKNWEQEWNFKSFTFSKNKYQKIDAAGGEFLRIESNKTAGGLWKEQNIDISEQTQLHWKWRVDKTLAEVNEMSKSGDDYSIRLYVVFEAPSLFGLIEGKSICYVWSSGKEEGTVYPSPYSDQVAIIVVETGDDNKGEWVMESRKLVSDFEKYFGETPEKIEAIAIMADTDNTRDRSISYIDSIELVMAP